MSAQQDSPWNSATKISIGQALAEIEDDRGLTASQLEDLIGKHQSNLKKAAVELVGAGALQRVDPPQPNGLPGRRAQDAFAFAAGERERFEGTVVDEPSATFPEATTQIVFVDAGGERDALWDKLSLPGAVRGVDRALKLVGEGEEMAFTFSGQNAVNDSEEFLELLKSKELRVRLQSIKESSSGREVGREARRRRERMRRNRERLRAMQIAPRPD